MDSRTALCTALLIASGFLLGRLSLPAGHEPPRSNPQSALPTVRQPAPQKPLLAGRSSGSERDSQVARIEERLTAIERLLPGGAEDASAAGSEETVVSRLQAIWTPVIQASLTRDRFARAKAMMLERLGRRLRDETRLLEAEQDRGHSGEGLIQPLEELRHRIRSIQASKSAPQLIAALTERAQEAGHMDPGDATALVHGYPRFN